MGNGLNIKGTLVHLLSDNLGANAALGFVESFGRTHYYCRFCECDRDECKILQKEDPSKRRNTHRYEAQIEKIKNSEKVDYEDTQGVKRFCELNNLKYFDMFVNMTPDIMHDLNEGAIPFLMSKLFMYCISSKLCKQDDLEKEIQFHDYGFKNTKNYPSLLSLKKKNLNQNAAQSLCLFQHIPFILHKLRNDKRLKDVWICVESLLRITQISYSPKIDEEDLNDLEIAIQTHLEKLPQCFKSLKVELIPKHHFITHYPNVIRSMGALNTMSMMRFESKHKTLKKIANESCNYINLTKTMAKKHQQMISVVHDNYTDKFINGKTTQLNDAFQMDLLKEYLDHSDEVYVTKHLRYNIFNYRKGLFVSTKNQIFEIEQIFVIKCNYYFLCTCFDFVEYDKFLNSIKILKRNPIAYEVIEFSCLENKNVFEKKNLNGEYYIILETLDLKNIYSSTN